MQAAAHGLPMVATKNGGPVDINRVIEELTLCILSGLEYKQKCIYISGSYLDQIHVLVAYIYIRSSISY